MKRNYTIFVVAFVISISLSYSQENLSQVAVNDFATQLKLQSTYGSNSTKQLINYSLRREGYAYEYAITVIENVGTNRGYREVMLRCIYNTFKNREQVFGFLHNLGMSALHATEFTNYIIKKFGNEERLRIEKEAKEEAGKRIFEEKAKKKYDMEHPDELRIADSLQKVEASIIANNLLNEEIARKKEVFLNATPELKEVVDLFNESQDRVLSYLISNGYIHYKNTDDKEIFVRKGAIDDSLCLAVSFRDSKLNTISYKLKGNDEKLNSVRDYLRQRLDFSGPNGSVLSENAGNNQRLYTGIRVILKNYQQKIRCEMLTSSYTKKFIITISFYRVKLMI